MYDMAVHFYSADNFYEDTAFIAFQMTINEWHIQSISVWIRLHKYIIEDKELVKNLLQIYACI